MTSPLFTLTPSRGRVVVRKYVPGVREPIVEIDWSITELAAMVAYLLTEVEEYAEARHD